MAIENLLMVLQAMSIAHSMGGFGNPKPLILYGHAGQLLFCFFECGLGYYFVLNVALAYAMGLFELSSEIMNDWLAQLNHDSLELARYLSIYM